jgi:hypothetical protein
LVLLFFVSKNAWVGLEMERLPPKVELKDNLGGRLDGTPWSWRRVSSDTLGHGFAFNPRFRNRVSVYC